MSVDNTQTFAFYTFSVSDAECKKKKRFASATLYNIVYNIELEYDCFLFQLSKKFSKIIMNFTMVNNSDL